RAAAGPSDAGGGSDLHVPAQLELVPRAARLHHLVRALHAAGGAHPVHRRLWRADVEHPARRLDHGGGPHTQRLRFRAAPVRRRPRAFRPERIVPWHPSLSRASASATVPWTPCMASTSTLRTVSSSSWLAPPAAATLSRMVAGLEAITGGEIVIGGRVDNDVEPKDSAIAMVFPNYALYPHLTVEKNMGFSLEHRGASKAEIAERVNGA